MSEVKLPDSIVELRFDVSEVFPSDPLYFDTMDTMERSMALSYHRIGRVRFVPVPDHPEGPRVNCLLDTADASNQKIAVARVVHLGQVVRTRVDHL